MMIRCLIWWMSWCGWFSVFYAKCEFETILFLQGDSCWWWLWWWWWLWGWWIINDDEFLHAKWWRYWWWTHVWKVTMLMMTICRVHVCIIEWYVHAFISCWVWYLYPEMTIWILCIQWRRLEYFVFSDDDHDTVVSSDDDW